MDLEIIILNEVSQTRKDKHHMISLISEIFKMIPKNLYTKQNRPTDIENKPMVTKKGKAGEGKSWEFGIKTYTYAFYYV